MKQIYLRCFLLLSQQPPQSEQELPQPQHELLRFTLRYIIYDNADINANPTNIITAISIPFIFLILLFSFNCKFAFIA